MDPNTFPTKGNLILAKNSLKLSRQGYELMDKQQTFEQALRTREFEPDAPNYTPRISGIMHVEDGKYK